MNELKEQWSLDKVFKAQMHPESAESFLLMWHKAVGRSQQWAAD